MKTVFELNTWDLCQMVAESVKKLLPKPDVAMRWETKCELLSNKDTLATSVMIRVVCEQVRVDDER